MVYRTRVLTVYLIFMISAGICLAQDDSLESPDFPVLIGPYLGQKPPGLEPEVFAPGVITRTDYWEHSSPAFSQDGKEVYWSAHVGPNKQRIFRMRLEAGRWSAPEFVPFWIDRHGGGPAFSPGGKKLYFYSKHPESHEAGSEFLNIWSVEKVDDGWADPEKLNSVINTEESDLSPSFTNEGTMYFSSSQDGGYGKGDIYCSKIESGQFVEPENLGDAINTKDMEFGSRVAPDGSYLLFSRFIEEPKGVSIYVCFRKPDGSWTEAQEMGEIIELCRKARFPGISPDGKYMFFCATRDRDVKVYWVDAKIIDQFRPDELK